MGNRLIQLEALRGFAATYVLLGHLVLTRLVPKGSPLGFLFRFGQEAVMLFFLLSGFVIYHSFHKQADKSFALYFTRRLLRIFPIFLIALALSYLSSIIATGDFSLNAGRLAGNIFMLQDFANGKPGVWVDTYAGNLPLWSLSYEWWFYMMFWPIQNWLQPRHQLGFVVVLSTLGALTYFVWPNQFSLFAWYYIIWWSGVEVARAYCAGSFPAFENQRPTLLALFCFCLAAGAGLFLHNRGRPAELAFGAHPVLEFRHFGSSLLILMTGLFVTRWRWAKRAGVFTKGFAALAPISYALYVLHYPLLIKANYLSFLNNLGLELLGYLAVLLVLAYVCEVKLQGFLNRLVRNWHLATTMKSTPVAKRGG